ncbi:MAG: TonB-dependent receptor [Calditrichaeota bacterium]|nr:TonB-dependent receptor [Calditrichota bacterium]
MKTGLFHHRNSLWFSFLGVFVVLATLTNLSLAQKGSTIKGRVADAKTGSPLVSANIILVGTTIGAASDQNGFFEIANAPGGTYQIKATYIGYKSQEQKIIVEAGKNVTVNFSLSEDFFQTEQVVVTATRTEKLLQDVPVPTEIVTAAEIAEKGAEDVSEILADRPGINIESGTSGNKFLYMNGVDSRRILILVDNVPQTGKLNNRIPLNFIDADKIDHIEIVKGPGSALYGNDALGGVINIITRGFARGLKIQANGRTGSNDLYSGNVNFSGSFNQLGYYFNIDHFQKGFDQGASEIQIKDTKSNSFIGKLKYNFAKLGEIQMQGEFKADEQNSESSFMGGISENLSKNKNVNTNLVWRNSLGDAFNWQFTGYYSDNFRTYESASQSSPSPASVDTTTDQLIGLKSDFTYRPLNQTKFDFGFDVSKNDYENARLTNVQARNQTGVFVQLEQNMFKKITLLLGGRYDKITDLKSYFSPRLSAMYAVNSDLKIRGSWGGGFRAPSFIELYSDFPIPIPGMPMRVLGNPDLEPETSIGGNIGIEYFYKSLFLINATYFHNNFKDLIVDYQAAPLTFSYLNVDKATFSGVELQTRLYLAENLTTTLSYNYTNMSSNQEDVAFSKISPHTGFVRIVYALFNKKLKLSLRDQFFSKRNILVVSGHSGDFQKVEKNPYHQLDLTVSYRLNNLLGLRVGVNNLTDYTDKNYGPYVGRRIFVGFNTTFQRK